MNRTPRALLVALALASPAASPAADDQLKAVDAAFARYSAAPPSHQETCTTVIDPPAGRAGVTRIVQEVTVQGTLGRAHVVRSGANGAELGRDAIVTNGTYSFNATKPAGKAGYTLNRFTPEPAAGLVALTALSAEPVAYLKRVSDAANNRGGYRLVGTAPAGDGRVEYKVAQPPRGDAKAPAVAHAVVVDFAGPAPRVVRTTIESRGAVTTTTYRYADGPDNPPRLEESVEVSKPASGAERRSTSTFAYAAPDLPPEAFTLTAYGLAEPGRPAPPGTPAVWYVVLAVAVLAAAFALRRLTRFAPLVVLFAAGAAPAADATAPLRAAWSAEIAPFGSGTYTSRFRQTPPERGDERGRRTEAEFLFSRRGNVLVARDYAGDQLADERAVGANARYAFRLTRPPGGVWSVAAFGAAGSPLWERLAGEGGAGLRPPASVDLIPLGKHLAKFRPDPANPRVLTLVQPIEEWNGPYPLRYNRGTVEVDGAGGLLRAELVGVKNATPSAVRRDVRYDSSSGRRLMSGWTDSDTLDAGGGAAIVRASETDVRYDLGREPDEGEFTLTAFGLPEPGRPAGRSFYPLGVLLAVALLAAAFALRRRYTRSAP